MIIVAVANTLVQVEAAWWLLFFAVFGLCLGSFLNVVIYRLPNDVSLRKPLWSFCPQCSTPIRWYDNLPVLSYCLLGGRCRDCRKPIAPRYLIVEMATALVVLLLFDAFFIARSHRGIAVDWPGYSWALSRNWPIFLAHVILFTSLLAMSAIDLAHYWVDVRFTTTAALAGFACHAIWAGPRPNPTGYASVGMRAGALVAVIALVLTLVLARLLRRPVPLMDEAVDPPAIAPPPDVEHTGPVTDRATDDQPVNPVDEPPACPPVDETVPASPARPANPGRGTGFVLAVATGVTLSIVLVNAWAQAAELGVGWSVPTRWWPALGLLFLLILVAGAPARASDDEIMVAIEAERGGARVMVLGEMVWLLPVMLLGGVTLYYGTGCDQTQRMFADILAWSPRPGWEPLAGLGWAASGFIIGGAAGWLVRWVATLVLGKEAFGSGDIHMMAAAGCVTGWEVVVVGFMLCSFFALAGWILTLPIKRVHAIPLGPWLSISFLLVVILYDFIFGSALVRDAVEVYRELLVIK